MPEPESKLKSESSVAVFVTMLFLKQKKKSGFTNARFFSLQSFQDKFNLAGILGKYHPKLSLGETHDLTFIPSEKKHHVSFFSEPLQFSARVPMSSGLPADVNISPVNLQLDL